MFGFRSEEQPSYEVLLKENSMEIRKYKSYIVAKTTINGTYKEAQTKGFRILAGYIFGKNSIKEKIAMTTPVTQRPEINLSEKIAMTAPVIMSPSSNQKSWTMTFTMPSKYNIMTLPKPLDSNIIIEEVPEQLVAVHRFTGFWSESKNNKKSIELLKWLETKNDFQSISQPMFAGYNPPWTLPFLRRNEMWVLIKEI